MPHAQNCAIFVLSTYLHVQLQSSTSILHTCIVVIVFMQDLSISV